MAIRCMAAIYLGLSFLPLVAQARWSNMETDHKHAAEARRHRAELVELVSCTWCGDPTYLAIRRRSRFICPPLLFAGVRFVIAGARSTRIDQRRGRPEAAGDRARGGAKARCQGLVSPLQVVGVMLLFAGTACVTFAGKRRAFRLQPPFS